MRTHDSVTTRGWPKKRYHAYILHNPHQKFGDWPGPWWGEVFDTVGFGIDGFLTESDAFEFLEKHFPNDKHAVQEIVWVAEPTRWHEKDGLNAYYRHRGEEYLS